MFVLKTREKAFTEETLTHFGVVVNEEFPKFALRYKSRGQL